MKICSKLFKSVIVAIFLLQSLTLSGQNLVPNSSFEVFDTCPNGAGQINNAIGWFNANTVYPSTTDYFHMCSGGGGECPPNTYVGYQWPHTGQAFVGMVVFGNSGLSNAREYVETELSDTLTGGKSYYVEYYAALANSIKFSISNLGACFTNSLLLNNNYTVIPVIPQIENPDTVFLSDTLNWMKVSGTFIALGGEKFITIGSFRNDSTTNDTVLSQNPAFYDYVYYFIDDVSVIPVDSLQGIADIKPADFLIFPNPVKDVLNVKFGNACGGHDFLLTDLTGKIILRKNFSSGKELQLDLSAYPAGMYFLSIEDGSGRITKKIIKQD